MRQSRFGSGPDIPFLCRFSLSYTVTQVKCLVLFCFIYFHQVRRYFLLFVLTLSFPIHHRPPFSSRVNSRSTKVHTGICCSQSGKIIGVEPEKRHVQRHESIFPIVDKFSIQNPVLLRGLESKVKPFDYGMVPMSSSWVLNVIRWLAMSSVLTAARAAFSPEGKK